MGLRNRLTRRLVVVVAVVVMLTASTFGLGATTRAQPDQAYEFFFSPQTGYFLFWNPAIWSVDNESAMDDGDWIRLRDGQYDAVGEVFAFQAPGLTTTDCLRTILDQLASAPSSVAVEALSEEGGSPQLSESGGDQVEALSSDVVLTTQGDDGTEKFAVRLECREIVPGQSLLAKTLQVPARVYNEIGLDDSWLELDLRLFEGLTLENRPWPVPDERGQVRGTIAAARVCFAPHVFGLAQNTSNDAEFVIDPSAFAAFDYEGRPLPISVGWSSPATERNASLALQPGEFALFQIIEDGSGYDITDVYYTPPVGTPILLSHFDEGCGAAGGAPVLIDID